MKINYENIPPELFEPATAEHFGRYRQTSPARLGYAKDAWKRFCKNKASITAAVIIGVIILFSLITPLLIRKQDTELDSYYAKKGAKIDFLSFLPMFDGGRERVYNERGMIHEYAIALGTAERGAEISDIDDTYKTVITPIDKVISSESDGRYHARTDSYAEVGFVYMQIDSEEYESIRSWETEHGKQIFFPLVSDNRYNPYPENANYWYMADVQNKNTPISKNGEPIHLTKNLSLADNYKTDESGELVYSENISTDGEPTYRVRVLYKNYYEYKHNSPPSFLLGTDAQGYDMALRLCSGIRLSLLISVAVSLINLVIGTVYGAVEGYFGGVYDLVLERIADILACIPFIVVATLFQLHLSDRLGAVPSLLFAFVLTGWIAVASRVRTQFYRFKGSEYVMSAKTLGASDARIILRHILPNALGTIVTSSVLLIPTVILNESMLSFLGIVDLGSGKRTSLGTLLSEASGIWTSYPHLMLAPAVVISLLMICFNLFGNGLRDALNPSLRGAED